MRARHRECDDHQRTPSHRGGAECRAGAYFAGDGANHRPEQRAANCGAHGVAEQLAAAANWGGRRQPGKAGGPGAGTAKALDEPGEVQDGGL